MATGADALRGHVSLAEVVLYYDFPRQMDEYARRTRDLSRRGFCGVAVSFLTSHDLRPLTPGFTQQARDDVERGVPARSKCPPWQCPTPAPAPSRGAPGGSGRLDSPQGEARPLAAQLEPRVLKLTTSKVADLTAFEPSGMLALCVKGSQRTSVLLGEAACGPRAPPLLRHC